MTTQGSSDNRPLSEIYADIAEQWVDAHAAASILEDTQSAFLSARILNHMAGGMAHNKAEATVKASQEWSTRVLEGIEARRKANLLRVKKETIEMRYGEWNSSQANDRIIAKL